MSSFIPPMRALMGPGPSDVHPRVLAAMARPTIGHLDPAFQELMDDIKARLKGIFHTQNALTFPISAPGSAGMEACIGNLLECGETMVICINGVFGMRMREVAIRLGIEVIAVEAEWGTAPDPDAVRAVLAKTPEAKALAFVHAETSTGVRADAQALCQIAKAHDCLTIVDAVTSLVGCPLQVDDWGIDAIYAGSQKCLSVPPGLSPVSFSDQAAAAVRARRSKVISWFLDLTQVMTYWDGQGGRSYHHTAPVNALYGLHEALVMVEEEGLEAVRERHHHQHQALVAGLEALGLEMLVAPDIRLAQLNTVKVPAGVDEAAVRAHLLSHYSLEIGAGLGPLAGKVWRIGLMGASARPERVLLCLAALEDALTRQQMRISPGAGTAAALAALAD